MAAVSSGNVARRTLADISNLPVQQVVRDGKPQNGTAKGYVEQLLKEKLQLVKILADRDKIIEVTGIELQKLRVNQKKMQEQNKQHAQSNSHLLAEVNTINVKRRALQHELACRNGLLKSLQHELESKIRVNVSEEEVKLTKVEDVGKLATTEQDADKQVTSKRRIHSKSLGPSRQVQSKEKAGNKRACVRRRPARFKSQEADSVEDLCAIPDTKLAASPLITDSVLENVAASTVASVNVENEEGNAAISHEHRQPSIGRPSRVAAKKVQSYKEVPLTVKMRRPD